MHGSMLVDDGRHGELELLKRIRLEFGNALPISVRLDLHGNIPDEFVTLASVITALRTAPHRDGLETALRTARLLVRLLNEQLHPFTSIVRVPLLLPGEMVITDCEPARSLYEKIPQLESDPHILAANIMVGFAWSDSPWSGASCIVSALSAESAEVAANSLARSFYEERLKFNVASPTCTLNALVSTIESSNTKTLFLSDSGDNITAGAPGNATVVLQTVLTAGLSNILFAQFYDPELVSRAVTLQVGDSFCSCFGEPKLTMELTLRAVLQEKGVTLVVATAQGNTLIFTDKRVPCCDPQLFLRLGLTISHYRAAIFKLGYLMPELEDLAKEIGQGESNTVLILSPGPTTLDITTLSYAKVPRPIYPLDNETISC
jgi:microcystin degradation protein MlrC